MAPVKTVSARSRRSGVTLIEVTVMLAVLAVLAALTVPSYGARLQRQRLQAAAEALAGDLVNARFEAARRGHALHLEPRAGADWCWSVALAPGCACGAAQACQIGNVRAEDHRGVRLVEARPARLDPAGSVGAAVQVATLESAHGERLRVDLTALGRARICVSAGSVRGVAAC